MVKQLHEIRESASADIRVHATCTNASASVNRNLGLEWAETDLIIMMDDDITRFPDNWDLMLAKVMLDNPKCAMVSPRLMNTQWQPGLMLGHPPALEDGSLWTVPIQELPTALIMIRKNSLRFDEDYIGSGWEDTDYCSQIRTQDSEAEFIVNGGVRVIHINEMKNQAGEIFDKNRAHYVSKWGEPR